MPCPARLWAWWPRWLLTIIINNVYAFQYPTKNRCTILVQPSFAKLVLLPIREAYEWKLGRSDHAIDIKAPSCFQFVKRMNGNEFTRIKLGRDVDCLASNSWSVWMETGLSVFWGPNACYTLASNSWSVWMETLQSSPTRLPQPGSFSCFQFVKRMNGNN